MFEQATNDMRSGASGRIAAQQFGIDQTMLRQYFKKVSESATNEVRMGYPQHRKFFSDKMENDLAAHCINLVKMHYKLSTDKVKMLAYKFAAQNQLPILRNWADEKKSRKRMAVVVYRTP